MYKDNSGKETPLKDNYRAFEVYDGKKENSYHYRLFVQKETPITMRELFINLNKPFIVCKCFKCVMRNTPQKFKVVAKNPYLEQSEKELTATTNKFKVLESNKQLFLKANPDFNLLDSEGDLKILMSDLSDLGQKENKARMFKICALIDDILKVKFSISEKYLRAFIVCKTTVNKKFTDKKAKKMLAIKKHFGLKKVDKIVYTPTAKYNKNVLSVEVKNNFMLLDSDEKQKPLMSRKHPINQNPLMSRISYNKVDSDGKKIILNRSKLADKTLNIYNLKGDYIRTARAKVKIIEGK